MVIVGESSLEATGGAPDPEAALAWFAWADAEASRKSDMTVAASGFISVLSIQYRAPGSNVTVTPNRVPDPFLPLVKMCGLSWHR
jgi:hypothetical protein